MTHNLPNEHLPVDEPTTQAITNLLRDFGEHPSKEFHTRHANAPWLQAKAPQRRANWYWRGMLMAGLMLLLWFTLPSGFVAALDEFFGLYRAPSDTVEAPQGTILPEAPAIATLEEASALVGFDIRTPSPLPEIVQQSKITVTGEQPDNMFAMIDYRDAGGYSYLSLEAKRGPLYLQIGATANVEIVQVGNVSGEYVQGGFIVRGNVSEWDSSYANKTLRWQIGDISYMLSSSHLSKQALIDLAAGMQ